LFFNLSFTVTIAGKLRTERCAFFENSRHIRWKTYRSNNNHAIHYLSIYAVSHSNQIIRQFFSFLYFQQIYVKYKFILFFKLQIIEKNKITDQCKCSDTFEIITHFPVYFVPSQIYKYTFGR